MLLFSLTTNLYFRSCVYKGVP